MIEPMNKNVCQLFYDKNVHMSVKGRKKYQENNKISFNDRTPPPHYASFYLHNIII